MLKLKVMYEDDRLLQQFLANNRPYISKISRAYPPEKGRYKRVYVEMFAPKCTAKTAEPPATE